MKSPLSLIPAGLVLLLGLTVLSMRHRTLAGLRERVRLADAPAAVGSLPAPPPVPASLLQLRGEHGDLRRSLEAASHRLEILSKTWEFDPDSVPSARRSAQAELMDDLHRLAAGHEFQEAVALGQRVAEYLARHGGRLPESMEALKESGSDAALESLGNFEFLLREPLPEEQRVRRFVARGEEMPVAGGRFARFFLKGDGSVVIASVGDRSDWDTWVAEQEAREKAASGQ